MIIVPAVGTPFWLVAALGCTKSMTFLMAVETTQPYKVHVDSETNIAT